MFNISYLTANSNNIPAPIFQARKALGLLSLLQNKSNFQLFWRQFYTKFNWRSHLTYVTSPCKARSRAKISLYTFYKHVMSF